MSRYSLPGLALAALLLTACQSNESAPISTEPADNEPVEQRQTGSGNFDTLERVAESREEIAMVQAAEDDLHDPAEELPSLRGQLESDGYGLSLIIDGSTPQAFADSLEMIAADTSAQQYQRLESAIRFLETYALGVDNLTEFYQSIDGQSAEEIIDRAYNRNRR